MGLIDEIRKKKDSWTARFEEHRKQGIEGNNSVEKDMEDDDIRRNRQMVGNYPKEEECD